MLDIGDLAGEPHIDASDVLAAGFRVFASKAGRNQPMLHRWLAGQPGAAGTSGAPLPDDSLDALQASQQGPGTPSGRAACRGLLGINKHC